MMNDYWYNKETDELWRDVYQLVKQADNTQAGLQTQNLSHLKAYLGRDIRQATTASYFLNSAAEQSDAVFSRPRPKFNVIASSIDTLISKISKNRVLPRPLTKGGFVSQKRKAENLTQFIEGIFLSLNVWDICKEAYRNALIFGTGFVKIYYADKRICAENVFPDEIIVDPSDAYYGKPMCMYQRKYVNKSKLKQMFPDQAEAIDRLQGQSSVYTGEHKDLVLTVEAWKRGKGGRHCIVADGVTLFDETYNDDCFPFATIRYRRQPIGFWGVGIADILYGIQSDIDRISATISDILRLMSRPRVFIEMSSKVNPRHINNDVGTFVPYSGTPPIINAPNTVPPELFMERENLIERAYREVGLTDMSASGRKPVGLDSGAALREFTDIESERFAETSAAWEQLFVDVAKVMGRILDRHPNYEVAAKTLDNGLKNLKWKDLEMGSDDYTWQVYPVSALPNTPAGKLQTVKEMLAAGLIEPDVGVELLSFPDLKAENRLQTSPRRLIQQTLEKIVTDGEYITPEPYFPTPLAKKIAQQYFCLCKLMEVPEDRLTLIQQFIDDVLVIETQAMQQSQMLASPAQLAMQAQVNAPVTNQAAPAQIFGG